MLANLTANDRFERLKHLIGEKPPNPDAMIIAQSLRERAENAQALSLLLARSEELKGWTLYYPMVMAVSRRAQKWEQLIATGKDWLRSPLRTEHSVVEIIRNSAMALRALRRIRTIKRLAVHLQWRFERGRLPLLLYVDTMRALHVRGALEKIESAIRSHNDRSVRLAYVESLVELGRLKQALVLSSEFSIPAARLSAPNRAVLTHFRDRSRGFNADTKEDYLGEIIGSLVQRHAPGTTPNRTMGGPIRILICASSLGVGGSERQLMHLLAEFDSKPRLYNVLVMVTHRRNREFPLGYLKNVRIRHRDELEEPEHPEELFDLASEAAFKDIELLLRRPHFRRSLRLAAAFEPHVVYNAVGLNAIDAILIGMLTSARDIVLRFGSLGFDTGDDGSDEAQMTRLISERMYTLLASRATYVANSHAAQTYWAERLGIPHDLVQVIWNGTAFGELFLPTARKSKKAELFGHSDVPVVGWVGRFHDYKRPDLWVRIALKLAEENSSVKFLMVGDGPLRSPIQQSLASSPYRSSFVFTGDVLEGLSDLYQAMDVLLVTSKGESFSNVVVEALGHGTYVVASEVGDIPYVINDPSFGRAVPSNDEEAFVECMKETLQRIDRISADRGRRAVDTRKRLSVARMWGAYVKVFRKHRDGVTPRQRARE